MLSCLAHAQNNILVNYDDTNQVKNSNFDQDNYPVWAGFNGQYFSSSETHQTGVTEGIADWRHFSPLFNQSYMQSHIGNLFLYHKAPYGTDGFDPYNPVPRAILIYGSQDWYDQVGSGTTNNNPDRGSNQVGYFTNGANTRIISNTVLSTVQSTDSFNTNGTSRACWCRDTEWQQVVPVPDSATTCTFGAKIRVSATDKLKDKNFAGIYIAEDREPTSGTFERYVNYFGIRHTNASFVLPTGSLSNTQSQYNWNGMEIKDTTQNLQYYTPQWVTATEHAMLDQDDYEDWEDVEYSFTLQTGTNRDISINLFFAENIYYIHNSVSGNTGGFQIYEPFVVFS